MFALAHWLQEMELATALRESGWVYPIIMSTHQIREAFAAVFGRSGEELGMELVYDVAHNIAKVERYPEGELVVHRKGATRAFGPGSQDLPACYRSVGQPVICGGSMLTLAGWLKHQDQATRVFAIAGAASLTGAVLVLIGIRIATQAESR